MKIKYLILPLLFISLFFGFSTVKADTFEDGLLVNWYNDFDNYITNTNSSTSNLYVILEYYEENYSSIYPYYYITKNYTNISDPHFSYTLYAFDTIVYNTVRGNTFPYQGNLYFELIFKPPSSPISFNAIEIHSSNGEVSYNQSYSNCNTSTNPCLSINKPYGFLTYQYRYASSNYNITFVADSNYTTVRFPYWSSSRYDFTYQSFELSDGDIIPSYSSQYNGDYIPSINYISIDLNDYEYVALSLKDYSVNAFDTNFMVEGQLCLTPVYNYGMTPKTDYSSGYQVARCSPVYDTSSPVRVSILDADIKNHAIYYLKAYNTSINNIIRVDSAIFNITPISSQNANNPSVLIEGRYYPTIPYNDLSSSATLSEDEGYVSGQVENVFDVSSDSSFISNIFSNPLTALQSVWSSIVIMFAIVGNFIAILPVTLQAFLYTSFSLALILGLFKIFIL